MCGKRKEERWGGQGLMERTLSEGGQTLQGMEQDRHDGVPVLSNRVGHGRQGGDPGGRREWLQDRDGGLTA